MNTIQELNKNPTSDLREKSAKNANFFPELLQNMKEMGKDWIASNLGITAKAINLLSKEDLLKEEVKGFFHETDFSIVEKSCDPDQYTLFIKTIGFGRDQQEKEELGALLKTKILSWDESPKRLKNWIQKDDIDSVKQFIEEKVEAKEFDYVDSFMKVNLLQMALEVSVDSKLILLIIENTSNIKSLKGMGCNVLHTAAHNSSPLSVIKALLDKKMDINAENSIGVTAAQIIVEGNDTELALYLIENGADPFLTNENNKNLLEQAYDKENIQVVRKILEKHPTVSMPTRGETFMCQLLAGRKEEAKQLVEEGVKPLEVRDSKRRTALYVAAITGDKELAAELIRLGLDVDLQDYRGNTPLHLACKRDHVDVIELLLQANARSNIMNDYYETPLAIAFENQSKTLKVFSDKIKETCNLNSLENEEILNELFLISVILEDEEFIQKYKNHLLLDPNYSLLKYSLIHYACKKGRKDLVEMALNEGGNINKKLSKKAFTPFYMAVLSGNVEFARWLIQKGADPSFYSDYERWLPWLAAESESQEMIHYVNTELGINLTGTYLSALGHKLGVGGFITIGGSKERNLDGNHIEYLKDSFFEALADYAKSSEITTFINQNPLLQKLDFIELQKILQNADKQMKNEKLVLYTGWKRKHATTAIFWKDLFIKGNKGDMKNPGAVTIYKIHSKEKIQEMIEQLSVRQNSYIFTQKVNQRLDLERIDSIDLVRQKNGNCVWIGFKLSLLSLVYLSILEDHPTVNREECKEAAVAFVRDFRNFDRALSLEKYSKEEKIEFQFVTKIAQKMEHPRKKMAKITDTILDLCSKTLQTA